MESLRLVLEVPDALERFFEATWEGCDVELAEGSVGSEGESQLRSFHTQVEAREFVDEQIAARRAQGYRDQSVGAAPSASENPELEALILADPGSVDPYLVYADWLQARGDPRGELIMLQYRLELGEDPALRADEHRLLRGHARRLLGPLAEQPELAELRFRLGFVERACLFRLEPRSFDLDEEALLASFLAHPGCRYLRELVLFRPDGWDYDGLIQVFAAAPHPTLTRLQIGSPGESAPRILPPAAIAGSPRLEELALLGGPLQIEGLAHDRLRRVLLQGRLDEALLASLGRATLPELESLELHHHDWSAASLDPDALVGALREHQRLVRLGLSVDDRARAVELCRALGRSPALPRLRSLTLTIPPSNELVEALEAQAASFARLEELLLGGAPPLEAPQLARLRRAGLHAALAPIRWDAACQVERPAPRGEDVLEDDPEEVEDSDEYPEDGELDVQITDYDLVPPPELEPEEADEEEEEPDHGVDRWDKPRDDPFDIDEE